MNFAIIGSRGFPSPYGGYETLVRHLNKVAPRKLMSLYLLAGKCIGLQSTTHLAERAHRILRRGKERAVS